MVFAGGLVLEHVVTHFACLGLLFHVVGLVVSPDAAEGREALGATGPGAGPASVGPLGKADPGHGRVNIRIVTC